MPNEAVRPIADNPLVAMIETGSIDIRAILVRRWLLLAIGIVLGAVLSIGYYFLATVKYESTAQILVEKKDARLPTRGTDSNNEVEARVSEDLLATHMEILQSPQVVSTALQAHGFDKLPSIVDHLKRDEDATMFVRDRLTVTRGGLGQAKTAHVLNIAFRHTSPEECHDILQAIVESYKQFLGDTFQDVSTEAVKLISQAKDELGADLDRAERQYQQFRENAPLLWKGDESANIYRVNYEQLQASLAEVQLEVAQAKSRYEVVEKGLKQMKARGATELEQLALLDDKHISRLELLVSVDRGQADTEEFQARQPARLEDARAEYEGLLKLLLEEGKLLADLGTDHPQVQAVQEHIKTTKKFLEKKQQVLGIETKKEKLTPHTILQAYLSLLNFDLITLENRKQQLEALANSEYKKSKEMISYELNGDNLRKQVARKQELYDAVIDRLREINLVKEYGGFVTEVIDEVQLGIKVSPKLSLTLALGSIIGLMLGVGAAFGAEYADNTFHGPDEIRSSLGLPILTHLPRLLAPEGKLASATVDPSVITFHRPRSRESEVFRGLRTSIFFSSRGTNRQIIVGTSANPGDGKTTMMANLAVSIAQSGRRVLLIDADMRRPRIAKLFGIEATAGLANVISGEVEPLDAVQTSSINNLTLLPSGTVPNNPAELLTSEPFAQLLAFYRERYDFILIDSPPLLAVADPCIIAQQADTVLLALRTSKDTRQQVVQAKSLLDDVGVHILGLVVNVADEGLQTIYGYNSYNYGYGYRYGYGYNRTYDQASAGYYADDTPPTAGDAPKTTAKSSDKPQSEPSAARPKNGQ